jgi:hypothetical protein
MTVAESARPVNRAGGPRRLHCLDAAIGRGLEWPQTASTTPHLDGGTTIIGAGR